MVQHVHLEQLGFIFLYSFSYFISVVLIKYQKDILKVSANKVKVILILDNETDQPSWLQLVSNGGKIKSSCYPGYHS